MAIIVFGGQKGGTGKSTLAFNIGAERAGQGRKVLMVDTDNQLTTVKWAERRGEDGIEPKITCISLHGRRISDSIKAQAAHYDDIIVDCHGGFTPELISALSVADKLITPTRTGQADIDTFAQVNDLIPQVQAHNEKLVALVVVNMALPGQRANKAKDMLREMDSFRVLDHVVRARVVFEDTCADGVGVTEYARRNPDAVSDLLLLAEEVWA